MLLCEALWNGIYSRAPVRQGIDRNTIDGSRNFIAFNASIFRLGGCCVLDGISVLIRNCLEWVKFTLPSYGGHSCFQRRAFQAIELWKPNSYLSNWFRVMSIVTNPCSTKKSVARSKFLELYALLVLKLYIYRNNYTGTTETPSQPAFTLGPGFNNSESVVFSFGSCTYPW
jgi:hypothetical protein